MIEKIEDREKRIYNEIMELENGSKDDFDIAFESLGILGNELTNNDLEKKLDLVENLINDYKKKKKN